MQELGENWREKFYKFENEPFAAASIGQVHRAITLDGIPVAVKIQYEGISESIDSDLKSLSILVKTFNLLPKSFFFDQFLENTKKELKEECDYEVEKLKQKKYIKMMKELKINDEYSVPEVIDELSTKKILTTEYMEGLTLDQVSGLSQKVRNKVGYLVMKNTIQELFLMNFMQTDPNFSNFFLDQKNLKLILLDFGAATKYDQHFCHNYMKVIEAASIKNRKDEIYYSKELGFLTGEENPELIENHCASLEAVAEPFGYKEPFDFGQQRMTETVYQNMPKMMKNRLKSPPKEVYSLHRKLSGAYLICIQLRAQINVH